MQCCAMNGRISAFIDKTCEKLGFERKDNNSVSAEMNMGGVHIGTLFWSITEMSYRLAFNEYIAVKGNRFIDTHIQRKQYYFNFSKDESRWYDDFLSAVYILSNSMNMYKIAKRTFEKLMIDEERNG